MYFNLRSAWFIGGLILFIVGLVLVLMFKILPPVVKIIGIGALVVGLAALAWWLYKSFRDDPPAPDPNE